MQLSIIKTIKSRYFLWPLFVFFVIDIFIAVFYSGIDNVIIFPGTNNYKYDYYTDTPNHGNSRIIESFANDTVISLKFVLNNKFHSPYVGLSISPLNNKVIDASKFNQISICIRGKNIDRVGLSIFTPMFNNINSQTESLYHKYINITNQPLTYNIPLNQLKHPEWWKDINNINELNTEKPDLSKIYHINIGSAFSANINNHKTIEIYSLAFTRNNNKLFIIAGVISALLILINFFVVLFIFNKKSSTNKVTVVYKPVNVTEQTVNHEKCIEYINQNYNNSNLTLDIIAEKTAIAQRHITLVINQKYNCNFKTYLNNIRISESKRLLETTNLTIGEIAFKVGFNNQSHFNRVFKTALKISPTQYRESLKR